MTAEPRAVLHSTGARVHYAMFPAEDHRLAGPFRSKRAAQAAVDEANNRGDTTMPDQIPRDSTARLDAYIAGDLDEPEVEPDDFADVAGMVADVQRTNPRQAGEEADATFRRRLRAYTPRPILAGYGNAADPQQGPAADLWCTFSLFDVDALDSSERALFHAARAEAILTALEPDHVMSAIIAAAQVHAQLATAWATIDRAGNP